MATPAEAKLLLAIVSYGTVSSIDWELVATELGCNKKAAAERWRVFKTKLPLRAGQAATDAQVKLLLAIAGSVQASGISWDAVGTALGCNKKAATERWRVFRVKREKMGQSLSAGEGSGSGKKSGSGNVKATTGAKKASPKKRKVSESEDEEGAAAETVVSEGGPVGGSIKKRARVESESGSMKAESKDQDGELGEGSENGEDEFFDVEDGAGFYGEGEEI